MTTGWHGIGDIADTTKGAGKAEPVEGVPAVSQPILLRTDEYVCAACWAPIITDEDGQNAAIQHERGCAAIAGLVQAAAGGSHG
jgi:hypothetical protein